jgi:hypothetical protein
MDPIAITAATLVAKWAAEGLVKEAAKSTWEGFKKVYEAVRAKFTGDAESTEVLQRLEQKPTSEARTQELAEVLDQRFKAEPAFAQELSRLVNEAGQQPTTASFVTQVMDNASVGKITNIETIHGDVHF